MEWHGGKRVQVKRVAGHEVSGREEERRGGRRGGRRLHTRREEASSWWGHSLCDLRLAAAK